MITASEAIMQTKQWLKFLTSVAACDPQAFCSENSQDSLWSLLKIILVSQQSSFTISVILPNSFSSALYFCSLHTLDLLDIVGLKKDLKAARAKDKSGLIAAWESAVINHLYYVAASTPAETPSWSDMVESKWRSLTNHVVNIHRHGANELYDKCAHSSRKRGEKKKRYMKKSTNYYNHNYLDMVCYVYQYFQIVRELLIELFAWHCKSSPIQRFVYWQFMINGHYTYWGEYKLS